MLVRDLKAALNALPAEADTALVVMHDTEWGDLLIDGVRLDADAQHAVKIGPWSGRRLRDALPLAHPTLYISVDDREDAIKESLVGLGRYAETGP